MYSVTAGITDPLKRDVLQPEISYTAYNTICYLVAGIQYRRLCSDKFQIELISRQSRDDTTSSTPLIAATTAKPAAKKRKKRPAAPDDTSDFIEISD